VRQAHQQVEKALGPVGRAGEQRGRLSNDKAEATSDDEWRRVLAVNVDGAFYWSRAVLPG
jgi:3-oxoacyl-[acyl-carrier protein] reductase